MKKLINLERLKAKLVNDFNITIKDILAFLQKVVFNKEIGDLSQKEVNIVIKKTDSELKTLFGAFITNLKTDWRGLFNHRYEVDSPNNIKALQKYADEVFAKPLRLDGKMGVTLDELLDVFSDEERKKIINAIRLAHHEGLPNAKLIQMIRGSRARNYQDGILAVTTRNAQTIARTGTAIMASEAKQAIIRDNADIIKGIKVIATLDRRTCVVAGTLIDTPNGQKPIEEIKIGDSVIGGSGNVKTVSGTLKSETNKLCKITLSDGRSFVCTQDHRWWTNAGWIDAEDLIIGDILPKTL